MDFGELRLHFFVVSLPHICCECRSFIGEPIFIEGWSRSSSYGWKHMVEYWWPGTGDHYVSNGMFIAAALAVGARIKTYPGSPNVALNLSNKMQFVWEAVS